MKRIIAAALVAVGTLHPTLAFADLVCMRINRARLERRVTTAARCPRGYITVVDTSQLVGPAGATGATGAAGADGADGALRVWGDGSDGDVTFSNGATLLPDKQYRNVTIPAGATVIVKHGTTLRATGTVTIDGTLEVQPQGNTPRIFSFDSVTYLPNIGQTYPGISIRPASYPECTSASGVAAGGLGGSGSSFDDALIRRVTRPTLGGGSGGGGANNGDGASGGGAFAVQAKVGVTVSASGVISAEAYSAAQGAGGGGGGVIILASNGVVTNQGVLNVSGGNGGDSTSLTGAGGGGGGGLVRVIAPSFNNTGTTDLAAGAPGSMAVTVTSNPRCAGAGGGGSAGLGGNGADVSTGDLQSGASAGGTGAIVTTLSTGEVEALLL